MIHAIRPIHETSDVNVMTVVLPAKVGSIVIGVLALITGIALPFSPIHSAIQPPSIALAFPIVLFCFGLFALLRCAGKRLVIDKPNAFVAEGRSLFGINLSAKKTSLNGYSGVQISALEESWIVELTGFEKPKLKLVEFASEDHARDFANRLRLFLQS